MKDQAIKMFDGFKNQEMLFKRKRWRRKLISGVGGFRVCISTTVTALGAFVTITAYVVRVSVAVFTDVHLE